MVKFLRRTWNRYSKLGKGRKKKQIWRRPTGRDNKMREKRRGYPARVQIGYKTSSEEKKILYIFNKSDFQKINKGDIIMIGKVGKKKKIEIAEEAKKQKIKLKNLNAEKFLKLNKEIKKK
ncbi:hypothetical protein ISS08_01850 [Candidatus Pacearchaeota archaeon]|nr:hypothetical protein [Candidatus Pacearchaeota archaeon]